MPHPTKLNYYWKKKTILSFFAIFFIIIIHNSATHQYTDLPSDNFTYLASFIHDFLAYNLGAVAVPLFFFISGLTFFRNYSPAKYPSKLRSRLKTLLIPYLIWNTFGLLFAILYTYTPLANIISGREAFIPTIGNILSGIFLYKYNFHFWFLFELIVFIILTPIFDLLTSRKWLAPLTIIVLLILPLFADSFLYIRINFIIYYYLGAYLSKHYFKTFTTPTSTKVSLFTGLFTLIILALTTFFSVNSIQLPTIISELLLICLVFSIWFFSDLIIPRLTLHQFYSTFFPIYAIHPYIIAALVKIILLIFPYTSWMLLINELTSPILTITISVPIVLSWHHYAPKSYALLFGERKIPQSTSPTKPSR